MDRATMTGVALYLAMWLSAAAGVSYVAMSVGYSFWIAAMFSLGLFFFINGSLAYRVRSRRLRQQGQPPPAFLAYLFFPKPLTSKIAMPKPIRVILGLVFVICGGFLALVGGHLAYLDFLSAANGIQSVLAPLVLSAVGLAIGYVGFRLMIMRNDDSLFTRDNRAK